MPRMTQLPKLRQSIQNNKNIVCTASMSIIAVAATIFMINALVGLWVVYQQGTGSLLWHAWSMYVLLILLSLMIGSVLYECYRLRQGGASFAQSLGAYLLQDDHLIPEEAMLFELNQELSRQLMIEPLPLYVWPNQFGINALTIGTKQKNTALIFTWGAVQHLDEQELYGLLSHELYRMLSGESIENTRLMVLYSGLIRFSQVGTRMMQKAFDQQQRLRLMGSAYVVLGSSMWLLGSAGILTSRLMKWLTLGSRTPRNDLKTEDCSEQPFNIQTLMRIHVHRWGSQIYSAEAEAISHLCYANALQPMSWLNVHPEIEQRLYLLDPSLVQELQLENLKKLGRQPLFLLFHSLEEGRGRWHSPWLAPQPLPLLRLSPISFAVKDAMRPLNPEVRHKIPRPEIIQRALQTPTGSREVLTAILMIRQYREFIPAEAQVSRAIVDALLHLDGRVHLSIFREASGNIGSMPVGMARQFLTKLAKVCQADGEIGLLDALLIERVKYQLNLLTPREPTNFVDLKPQIVRLIDALLHVQQLSSGDQLLVRQNILKYFLQADELAFYEEISDEPIDLGEILHEVAGLLLRERLSVLALAEMCLWHDWVITQDELDVLQLLYWRLGFETGAIVEQMHKKNSIVII